MAKQDPDKIERRLRREAAEEALAEAADADPRVAQWLDDDLEKGVQELFGMSSSTLQNALNEAIPGLSDKEVKEAMRDAKAAREAMEGKGWLGKPDPELAAKIIKRNKSLTKFAKSRGKGCAVVGVLLAAALTSSAGAATWGAVELVAALLG